MSRLRLSLAIGDYDHVRDLCDGTVTAAGIDLIPQRLPVEEVFYRFTRHREWDVSEMSLAKYTSLRAAGDESLSAVPVFPSRAFRHSAIYVRSDRRISEPADLAGCRVGVPEWAQTAGVWVRGMLAEDYGLDLASVEWVQAGVNQPGRIEKVTATLPVGVSVKPMPDRSLSEMLAAGEIDAALSARAPDVFLAGTAPVRRLWPNAPAVEREWWARTGVFPIMHILAVRADVLEASPWVARNLLAAFEEAKQRSVERLRDITVARLPLPWTADRMAEAEAVAGGDPFPYGLEPNRATLERFLRHAADQGLVPPGSLAVDDLFWPTVHGEVRV